MPSEDLGLPGPYGASQAGQLGDLEAIRPAVEPVQCVAGRRHDVRGVDGPQQLLALPGHSNLAAGITSRQAISQSRPSAFGELLCSRQQQLADAVQRITLTAPMPRVACCRRRRTWSTTRLASRMAWEAVHHHGGVAQRCDQGAGIAAPGVEGDRGDLGQPVAWPGMEPGAHGGPGAVQGPGVLSVYPVVR